MAAGKVVTGLSKPYVAEYSESNGTITYSEGRLLGRARSVSVSVETASDNDFSADNIIAESASGAFTSGELSITIDGLLKETEVFIYGLPEADADGWTAVGDGAEIPYLGCGVIYRHMSGGVTTYTPIIFTKVKFAMPSNEGSTQETDINWQDESLTAQIFRADDADHNWKLIGSDFDTEAAAEAALKAKLGISTT